jgi:Tfp pilus assembly protein PilF
MRFANPLASLAVVAVCLCGASPSGAQAVGECGNPFVNSFGPFDYRVATSDQRSVVETHHFTPAVEMLKSGSTGAMGSDIDYTLRAFPNHPRALMAMIRLGQRDKVNKPQGAGYTVDCYIERALQFQPDDVNLRQIRGIYLSMQGKYPQAIGDFTAVIEAQPENGNAHYNLGLAYFETKNYDRALAEAKSAQALKFPLDGLTKKLRAIGKWQD